MYTSKRLTLITILLALLLAACGGGEAQPTPAPVGDAPAPVADAPTPTPAPAATPTTPAATPTTPPAAPSQEDAESLFDASRVQRLSEVVKSYRGRGQLHAIITYPDGAVDEQTLEFSTAWVLADNPAGFNSSMTLSGFMDAEEEGFDEFTTYLIDDAAYIRFGDQWITSSRAEADMDDLPHFFASPETLTEDLHQLRRVGQERVNNIPTIHYSFDDRTFLDAFLERESDSGGRVQSMRGDMWVATEGEYVVKMSFQVQVEGEPDYDAEGNEVLTNQSISWSFEIYDVNQDIAITPPVDAPRPGEFSVTGFEPGAFPLPPDTTLQGSFGDFVSLVSELSVEEVTAFYDQALPALGWTTSDGFFPEWSKDGISFTMIVTAEDAGGTIITIMGGQ